MFDLVFPIVSGLISMVLMDSSFRVEGHENQTVSPPRRGREHYKYSVCVMGRVQLKDRL